MGICRATELWEMFFEVHRWNSLWNLSASIELIKTNPEGCFGMQEVSLVATGTPHVTMV